MTSGPIGTSAVGSLSYKVTKRIFDFVTSVTLSILLFLPMLMIAFLVKTTSKGRLLYWSDRVGFDNTIFRMPKFRTMRSETPTVATHLLKNPGAYLTPIGLYLRRLSLDEFPQLWSVLKGDMSIVGPRPALYNQNDLIQLRTERGIHKLTPGITGWAQINGRDDLPIPQKVEFDEYYMKHRSFYFDLKIFLMTVLKAAKGEGVRH